MIELLMTLGPVGPKPIIGQMTWTVPGTYQWTVPEGVQSICALVVGAGSSGYIRYDQARGGFGGAVRWRNNYSVTPGSVLTVVVGRAGGADSSTSDIPSNEGSGSFRSQILDLWAGDYQSASTIQQLGGGGATSPPLFVGGGNGGMYDVSSGSGNRNGGGSSGLMTNVGYNGADAVNRQRGLRVTNGTLVNPVSAYGTGASAGGGGGAVNKAAAGINQIFGGGNGAVRVIWGNNRWYPDKNIVDM